MKDITRSKLITQMTDTIKYILDNDIKGDIKYSIMDPDSPLVRMIAPGVQVVGKCTNEQLDQLINEVSEYGFEFIKQIGVSRKLYNDRLNWGLIIEYPVDGKYTSDSNLYIYMYYDTYEELKSRSDDNE